MNRTVKIYFRLRAKHGRAFTPAVCWQTAMMLSKEWRAA